MYFLDAGKYRLLVGRDAENYKAAVHKVRPPAKREEKRDKEALALAVYFTTPFFRMMLA